MVLLGPDLGRWSLLHHWLPQVKVTSIGFSQSLKGCLWFLPAQNDSQKAGSKYSGLQWGIGKECYCRSLVFSFHPLFTGWVWVSPVIFLGAFSVFSVNVKDSVRWYLRSFLMLWFLYSSLHHGVGSPSLSNPLGFGLLKLHAPFLLFCLSFHPLSHCQPKCSCPISLAALPWPWSALSPSSSFVPANVEGNFEGGRGGGIDLRSVWF